MRKLLVLIVVSTALALAACGQKMSGTYESVTPKGMEGLYSLEFISGSKAKLVAMGTKGEIKYSLDGDKLTISTPEGSSYEGQIQSNDSFQLSLPIGDTVFRKKN